MAINSREAQAACMQTHLSAGARLVWIDMMVQSSKFIYPRRRIGELLGCSKNKAAKIIKELTDIGAVSNRGRDEDNKFLPGYTCTRPQFLESGDEAFKTQKLGNGVSFPVPQKSAMRKMGSLLGKYKRQALSLKDQLPEYPEHSAELAAIFESVGSVVNRDKAHFFLKVALQEFEWSEIRHGALGYANQVRARKVKKQVAALENWLRDGRWEEVIDDTDTDAVITLPKVGEQ